MRVEYPCRGCADRRIAPNCHEDLSDCPHGYRAWLAEKRKEAELQKEETEAVAYVAQKAARLKRLARK